MSWNSLFESYDMARRIFLGSNRDYLKNHGLFIDNLYFPYNVYIYWLSAITSIERLLTSIKLVLHNLYTGCNILYLHMICNISHVLWTIHSNYFFLFIFSLIQDYTDNTGLYTLVRFRACQIHFLTFVRT